MDHDCSGSITKDELYLGVIKMHLELAKYLGPAACKPATSSQITSLFHAFDADKSNTLDEGEFSQLCTILCSHVLSRVLLQFAITIVLVPIFAARTVNVGAAFLAVLALKLEAPAAVVASALAALYGFLVSCLSRILLAVSVDPSSVVKTVDGLKGSDLAVPLVACVMTSLLLPVVLDFIDSFFKKVADSEAKATKGGGGTKFKKA